VFLALLVISGGFFPIPAGKSLGRIRQPSIVPLTG
jgi:hypothetical protein